MAEDLRSKSEKWQLRERNTGGRQEGRAGGSHSYRPKGQRVKSSNACAFASHTWSLKPGFSVAKRARRCDTPHLGQLTDW